MSQQTPGLEGILGIVAATGATCAVVTVASGSWALWLPCSLGVLVGLWATQAANK